MRSHRLTGARSCGQIAPTINAVRTPTLKDVAKAAGVHPATASRALNPDTRKLVNAETARRVQKAASALHYTPNPIARGLKTAKSSTIGVVIPDLTNPLFPPIVRGIEDALGPTGYSALIVNTDSDQARERAQVESLLLRQVEGLVVATALLEHPLLSELHQGGTRMVLVNRRSDNLDVSSVLPDDAGGIDQAIRHLAQLGHRRILHLAGPLSTSTGTTRALGYHGAIRSQGLEADPALVVPCAQWSEAAGAAGLRTALDAGTSFTAIVAANDLIALGCYDVFAERGIDCPDDVSVVGFNGIPFLDKLRPPLTTATVPLHRLGSEAARMLLETIAEPDRPARSVLLAPVLEVRGSTAKARRAVGSRR